MPNSAGKTRLVLRRLDWRNDTVVDVVAGRITGEEAHARFLEANRSHPKATENLRALCRGRSDEERTARQLVGYVTASGLPGAKEVAAELECVLTARFAAECSQRRLPNHVRKSNGLRTGSKSAGLLRSPRGRRRAVRRLARSGSPSAPRAASRARRA